MCGISFYAVKNGNKKLLKSSLLQSLIVTSHRGPDGSGEYCTELGEWQLGLGHNRLSIIDLSEAGKQPMTSQVDVTIIFNGEIYNFKSLRDDLLSKGCAFSSQTDTEVILQLYLEYGVKSFKMLRGMFAITILDKRQNRLFVVRDAVGIKPLYLYDCSNGLYGASEIKALRQFQEIPFSVDNSDLFEFFNTGFLYEPSTGFSNIKKLMPAHYLELDLTTGEKKISRYANIYDYYTSDLPNTIKAAINNQEISDVPLGTFFSGGIDSSILAACVNNNGLLFAKYDSDPSADLDLKFSKEISTFLNKKLTTIELGTDNKERDEIISSIDFVAEKSEEMISDYTFWATYQLSKAARDAGYKVMLSGMGGDEVFAGYPRYKVLKNHRLIKLLLPVFNFFWKKRLYPKRYAKIFERLVSYAAEPQWENAYSRMLGYMSKEDLICLFSDYENKQKVYTNRLNNVSKSYQGDTSDKVKMAQHMDMTGFLSHNLTVSDKASMLAGLELRVPLLDESLVAAGIKSDRKELMKNGILKFPLKKYLNTLLPREMFDRPKTGFNPPLDGLITTLGRDYLTKELATLANVVSIDRINFILDQHFSFKVNNTYKIWQLFYISRWLKFNP